MLQDLARTMFYKAGFDVEAEQGQDVLWQIVLDLREWVIGKAKRSHTNFPGGIRTWSEIKGGTVAKSSDNGVTLVSCLHVDDGVYTWACVLTENQSGPTGTAPRVWMTEIGFKGASLEKGRFSIVLSYGDRPGFIGKLQDDPLPSLPSIIRIMLGDKKLSCSEGGVELSLEALEITPDFDVFSLITDPSREIPVVLISPTSSGELLVEPERLASTLGPNALVLYTRDKEAAANLNNALEHYNLKCYGGALRVYGPKPDTDNPGEFTRHRYVPAIELRLDAEGVVTMLRRALAQDVHFWTSLLRIEDVKRMNRISSTEKRFKAEKGELEDEFLKEMIEAEQRARDVEEERNELREENRRLKARCDCYEQAFGSSDMPSRDSDLRKLLSEMTKLPKTPREVAQLAVSVFSNEIDFSEQGWASLDECTTDPNVLWTALRDIARILHPLLASDESIDIVAEFTSKSRFSYARSEGKQTRKDPKLMAQRKDIYQGREIFIERHISSSTGDPSSKSFIRVYFDYDKPSGKIVIGQCGSHMDNYTTRSLR